ncbi:Beta-glucuronidase [compost metagenome]
MMKQGYERVTNGNQIVATLPDEWRAMLDPLGGGVQIGLWKPTLGDESWMKLKTSSQTWSDQGLRYYKGDVWYRTKVDVPASFSGKQVKLWLSSIDESARVWLNGTELTNTAKGKALGSPWEFNATPAVRFGEPNVLVIDVTNKILDELGTGGIMGPVVLWSPGL